MIPYISAQYSMLPKASIEKDLLYHVHEGLPTNSGIGESESFAFWVHLKNQVNTVTLQ